MTDDTDSAAEFSFLAFTPFRVVPLGHGHELRIDLARKGDQVSVSFRHWKSRGSGRSMRAEAPVHLFPERLPALLAALTEAAKAIGVEPTSGPPASIDPAWRTLPLIPQPHGTRPRPIRETKA